MSHTKIIALKQQLRQRFPGSLVEGLVQATPQESLHCGFDAIDALQIPARGLSEICASVTGSCGLSLLLYGFLHGCASPQRPLALVDLRATCDVKPLGALAERLLWIRGSSPELCLRSSELLVQDGNLPVILLDLSRLSSREQSQIRPACWHRLRQSCEQHGCALLVLTQRPLLPSAHFRCHLETRIELGMLHFPTQQLLQQVRSRPQREIRTG